MNNLQITAETRETAMQEALHRLCVPEEALDIEWAEENEELLAGARPHVQMNVRIRFEYLAEKIRSCLEALIEKMQIEGTVEVALEDGIVIATIESDRTEDLIGYQGETLDALQHLVVRMTGLGGRDMPLILIDAGEYRWQRFERLRRVARSLAELAMEKDQEEFFDPMDAVDRKIVHTILRDMEGVRSYSRGEGHLRQVIVAPE